MKTVFIYALKDPTTDEIRYIGKSVNPVIRLRKHLIRKEVCHRTNWIKTLLMREQKPVLEILDEVPDSEWQMWEVAYIQFFREEGCDLTNGNAGGEGGHFPSEETRNKLSIAARNRSSEHREKLRAAHLGKKKRPLSPETRAKISVAQTGEKNHHFGKQNSPEVRAKISAANSGENHPNFGKSFSLETRAKLSAAMVGNTRWLGKTFSESHRAAISAAKLGKKHSPKKII